MKSVFWVLAFLCSLVFLAAAYYVTSPTIRAAIDARAPWVGSYLGPYVRGPKQAGQSPRPEPQKSGAPEISSTPVDSAASNVIPPPGERAVAEPEVFDLKKLAANRAAWPAKIKLVKTTNFPAVANGKVVGSLSVPAGTEVGLVTISGGKLGVEYQGGGAWLFVEETDLVARTQKR